jgi:hypothetical protein
MREKGILGLAPYGLLLSVVLCLSLTQVEVAALSSTSSSKILPACLISFQGVSHSTDSVAVQPDSSPTGFLRRSDNRPLVRVSIAVSTEHKDRFHS